MKLQLMLLIATSCMGSVALAQDRPQREQAEDVRTPEVRQRSGLAPGGSLLFNGWGVTPAGQQIQISDMPLRLVVSPDHKTLAAVSAGYNKHGLTLLDIATRQVTQFLPMPEAFNGLAFSRDGKRIFVSGGERGSIWIFNYEAGKAEPDHTVKPDAEGSGSFLAGLCVHPESGTIFVCDEAKDEVWALNPDTLAIQSRVRVGAHPYYCVLGADRRHLYVSNWGGQSVSVVDTKTSRRVRDLNVGLRPNDMALTPDGRLFVACSGDNTVHVIQTRSPEAAPEAPSPTKRIPEGTREIISTSLYPESPEGSTPDAVAVSPDGSTLFVANADNNCVMVADISGRTLGDDKKNQSISIVNGFIPVGWYPTALAVSPDGQTLFVANGKGLHSRANAPARLGQPGRKRPGAPFDYIGQTFEGWVSFVPKPDAAGMAAYTEQVRRNSPYTPAGYHQAPVHSDSVIPDEVGRPCPIKYVLYIIKENRTYDQVFGDMKNARGERIGNGDPGLTLYGENVTPNQHQLAREYVLLDNLYCNGEVSVDGHSWCDAAIATDFNQRSWITSYSKHGKLPGNPEMETPASGYLWDLCRRHGISYRNYGEGSGHVPSNCRGAWPPTWTVRDMDKPRFWINDLHAAERGEQELPRFTIMSLGENHTQGTTPGTFTPSAEVASNDIGVGRIVEAATRSRFWNQMAIFIIEDDAQNGPDHVDAHRTVGLVISPYCKRGAIDSALYTTASMIRTMELILGLPPLTQYDAGATPMFSCFDKECRPMPYSPVMPTVDLYAKNTEKSPLSMLSKQLDFSDYDRAPEDVLNRILWTAAKADEPIPAPIHRVLFMGKVR